MVGAFDRNEPWPASPLEAPRPRQRESALAQRSDARVRALVLLTFPAIIALLWPLVEPPAQPLFIGAVAWIIAANVAGYVVPWQRVPRWVESIPPISTIVALWLLTAAVGGFAHGYAILMLVPLLWLVVYGDAWDIAIGYTVAAACLLIPVDRWLTYLPAQGTPRQHAVFLIMMFVLAVGVRPVIWQLRGQVAMTRRALHALRSSQATLAHDLRNPLSVVRSLATLAGRRLAEDSPGTNEKVAEYADVIVASARRAEQVIDGVLELSRAGELLPWARPFDLRALVAEVAAGVPGIDVDTAGAPGTVVGHRPSIARLFANLLENAARHAGAGAVQRDRPTHVTVTGDETSTGWTITVRDDGAGVDPELVTSLFEPWSRGSGPPGDRDGVGLGLAIVSGIVEQHGGSIGATNAEPRGAQFTFTLARQPAVAGEPPERSRDAAGLA